MFSLAQVAPGEEQIKAWQAFNEQSGNKWTLRWNEKTGTPAVLYGPKTVSYLSINQPEEIALQFLKDHRAIFKMKSDLSDLSKIRSLESDGVTVIDFQQNYNGIPILGAEYSVAVGADKSIIMTAGNYFPSISCNTKPAISKEQVMERSLKATNIKKKILVTQRLI